MRSSQAAVNLIVASEVSSKETYIAKFQRPEWPPGGNSGITVGIGYDLGYATPAGILADWKDYLAPNIIRAMQGVAGLKGQAAHNALAGARTQILVPWEAAMAVFIRHDMPKWEAIVLKAIPGSEQLPAGCFGVLASIAYNRGASFSKPGDRYTEMRNIRMHVVSGMWDKVPDDIRSMKRLWTKPSERGLLTRREAEAALWEHSLAAAPQRDTDLSSSARVDSGDDRDPFDGDITPTGNDSETPINIQPSTAVYNVEVETIQRALVSMNYHEVGDVDGKAGGKLVAGIAAFMTDRGKDPNKGRITPELKIEINAAKAEGWSRPIAPERANATAKDIAPKVASVNQTWYAKLYGYMLGVPAAATAGFKAIFGDYNDPSSYIYSVKSFFGAIPSEYYFAAIAGIAAIIVVQAVRAQNATVKAYQRGEIN
jgi:hypothetical protein